MHSRPWLSVCRTAASLNSPLSNTFLQTEQARVWSLQRLRLPVSNSEWYCCHSEADSLGGSLIHVSIPLQTSLRLQRETASSLPATMLCSSGGMFRSRDLLLTISTSSAEHRNHPTCLPLLLRACHLGFNPFKSCLTVTSQSVLWICSHRIHLVDSFE